MRPSYIPYRCPNCDTLFEIELRKVDEKIIKCPNCPNIITIPKRQVNDLLHRLTLKNRLPRNENGSLK